MPPILDKLPRHLKHRAVAGSIWSVVGFGGAQVLRLISNLMLTRLLFPEVFGVVALVQVVLQGTKMFSDVGVSTSVIRDSRGDETVYLNTAWTLQTIRGVIVWLICCALAYPASILYSSPELVFLIPAIALTAFIQGFNAPVILTLRRHLKIKQLMVWELAVQAITILVTVVLAWKYQSVWAIAIGGIVGALFGCVSSYFISKTARPVFYLEPSALTNILSFGRWIFLSTALTFLIQQGDVLVLGSFLTAEQLGIFSIAAMWSRILLQLVLKINDQVMMPLYSEAFRDDQSTIKQKIRKGRLPILILTLPIVWIMAIGGQFIIDLLYDPRYSSAGWMLQVLSIGTIGSIVTATAGTALLSFGDSYGFMLLQVSRAVLLVACMAIGGYYFDIVGLIVGVTVSKIIGYPFLAILLKKHNVWLPAIDLGTFVVSGAVILAGFWVFHGPWI